jgi:hypothetical protein
MIKVEREPSITSLILLYDSLVQPIIGYGASIWGYKSFSCIEAVQNRAMRYSLGVGKRTQLHCHPR